jgi:hypothetical protein
MTDWFDPDAIRGDIESTLTGLFDPPVYDPAAPYAKGDYVQLDRVIYRALVALPVTPPPSLEWDTVGTTYKLVYENVESRLDPYGSIRIQISWGISSFETLYCNEGATRSVAGVATFWIITPKNQGTSQGLQATARLRAILGLWNRLGTCGKQVRISAINGPQASDVYKNSDLYVHILTATLTALETVPFVR